MTISQSLHRAADFLSGLPGIRQLDRKAHHERFLGNQDSNLFWGVFNTFDQAAQSAPQGLKLGYDNQESASIPYTSAISPRDYPAMFWLLRSLNDGMRSIFDLGGHTGVKYYAFRRTMNFPKDLQWTVCDVPAVVERGEQMAVDRAPEGHLAGTRRTKDRHSVRLQAHGVAILRPPRDGHMAFVRSPDNISIELLSGEHAEHRALRRGPDGPRPAAMTGVFCLGISTLDYVYSVETLPTRGEKYRSKALAVVGGGCSGNASVAIARLGGRCWLATRLADDLPGDEIVADLVREGVETGFARRVPGLRASLWNLH
eukprot:gene1384-1840_t